MICTKTRASTCIVILLALMLMCARAAIADVLGGDGSLFQRDKQVTSQCVACNISYLLESRTEIQKTGKTLFPRHSCDTCRQVNLLAGTVATLAFQSKDPDVQSWPCPLWLRHQSILR